MYAIGRKDKTMLYCIALGLKQMRYFTAPKNFCIKIDCFHPTLPLKLGQPGRFSHGYYTHFNGYVVGVSSAVRFYDKQLLPDFWRCQWIWVLLASPTISRYTFRLPKAAFQSCRMRPQVLSWGVLISRRRIGPHRTMMSIFNRSVVSRFAQLNATVAAFQFLISLSLISDDKCHVCLIVIWLKEQLGLNQRWTMPSVEVNKIRKGTIQTAGLGHGLAIDKWKWLAYNS